MDLVFGLWVMGYGALHFGKVCIGSGYAVGRFTCFIQAYIILEKVNS